SGSRHSCGSFWERRYPVADEGRAFSFLRINQRPAKPRTVGLTEMRGPYYSLLGPHYLQDILETFGASVDILKFAGGSLVLMPRTALRNLIDLCHHHQVLVSTGGFLEFVLPQGSAAVERTLT